MNSYESLLDPKALQQLVDDIGIEDTRNFMNALDTEFQKRITNIRDTLKAKSFSGLAQEAHALKSSAQISGAYRLAEVLTALEMGAKAEDETALDLAQEAVTLADLTRFAFLEVKLEK